MSKKLLVFLLCALFCTVVGCNTKQQPSLSVDEGDKPSSEVKTSVPENTNPTNPLTGLKDIDSDKISTRPVAIMINNISNAQPVQTGIAKADIVYETEVEGGITRLLAVFQDVTKAEKIGSIRSARYPFVDLALGHNAIYLHRGEDPNYCKPHLKDIDDIDISESNYAVRISNGLSSEHTLYTYGDKLWKGLLKDGVKITNKSSDPWVKFADENSPLTLANPANSVKVSFSNSYQTEFRYDSNNQKYVRYFNNTLRKDYFTKETINVKNVFVLMTTITDYSDAYHRKVSLQSGNGYYLVNGTYTAIKWNKGGTGKFKFTNEDGTELSVNPGNSWVCIADSSKSQPVFG